MQLAIQGFLECLAGPNSPLRKLPTPPAAASAEQDLAAVAHQDDADVGPKPLGVYGIRHARAFFHKSRAALKSAV